MGNYERSGERDGKKKRWSGTEKKRKAGRGAEEEIKRGNMREKCHDMHRSPGFSGGT